MFTHVHSCLWQKNSLLFMGPRQVTQVSILQRRTNIQVHKTNFTIYGPVCLGFATPMLFPGLYSKPMHHKSDFGFYPS